MIGRFRRFRVVGYRVLTMVNRLRSPVQHQGLDNREPFNLSDEFIRDVACALPLLFQGTSHKPDRGSKFAQWI